MSRTLPEIRRELGELVGADLDVVAPALGGNVNPPCVVVGHDTPFLTPATYDTEQVHYILYVVAGPGEASARLDQLETNADQVRAALRGSQFSFVEADPPTVQDDYLVMGIHVIYEREC